MRKTLLGLPALALAVLLALYAGLGFLALPPLLKDKLVGYTQASLGHTLQIEALRFNPFNLRLEADGVKLVRKDAAPLASFKQLRIDLQWRALLRGVWHFGEVRLVEPEVHAGVNEAGRLNWADLLAALPREGAQQDKALPRLQIDQLGIERGRLDLYDRSRGALFSERIAPIDLDLRDLSTLEKAQGKHTLKARFEDGGSLTWTGKLALNPVAAEGSLALSGLPLATPWQAALPATKARASGTLALNLSYRILPGGPQPVLVLEDLEASAEGVSVTEAGAERPLLSLAGLRLAKSRVDLTGREVTLGELTLSGAQASLTRDPAGRLNLERLLPAAVPGRTAGGAQDAPAAGPAPTPWKLSAPAVRISESSLRFRDESFVRPVLAEIGRIDLSFAARTGLLPLAGLELSGASLTIADLALAGTQLAGLQAEGGTLSLDARSASVEALSLTGLRMQAALDEQGRLDWQQAFERPVAGTPGEAPASAASGPPWRFALGALKLEGGTVGLQDRSVTPVASLDLENLAIKAAALNYPSPKPVDLSASASIRQGGKLALRGRLTPEPLSAALDMQVDQVNLAVAQPYLASQIALKLVSGTASANGRLALRTQSTPALSYEGALSVDALRLDQEGLKDPFLAWKSLATRDLRLSLAPGSLAIGELVASEPQGELFIAEDRSVNFSKLLKAQPAAPAVAAPAPATLAPPANVEPLFPVSIQRVKVENARLDFEDLSLIPPFGTRIHELSGVISGVSNDANASTRLSLDGRVDEYGHARIRGEVNFFAPRQLSVVNATFRNLDMSRMSPYAAKFAGHRIVAGRLTTELQYRIRAGQLEAENKLVINRIELGEEVDAPGVTKLPLRLAIALLEDADGNIDLDIPIRGNLDDPEFSYGPLVWKAIGNVLSNIITAPFRALARLFGGSAEEDVAAIEFDPGSARVLPPEREKLAKVAKALAARPQLRLAVSGGYDPAADANAMRRIAVRNEIARRMGLKVEGNEDPGTVDNVNPETQRTAENLYSERYGSPELRTLREEVERAEAAKDARERNRAVMRAVMRRLVERTPLPESALTALAGQRAAAIVALLAEGGTARTRVELKPVASGERGKNGVPSALSLSAAP